MTSNKNLAVKETENYENRKKVKKATFCIISNFRTEMCKFKLMLFALDNSY
jgi:hypothetical protein